MPTAGEYKHEPSGIPCHCYVRRRLHHSTCKKSCLRKQSDSSCQYDTKSKKVTFNPILSIRSYENQPNPDNSDTRPLLNTSRQPADSVKSHHHDHPSSNNTSTLCNKLTSLFYSNQQRRSSNDTKNSARLPSKHTHCLDHNNNVTDQGDKMHTKKFCPICESKRNKSPVRGYHYQKTIERSPSPCGFHQYQTPKVSEPFRSQKHTNSSRVTPVIPANSKYHVPRRLFRRDSMANSSEETSTQEDTSAGYENMNTLAYISSTTTDLNGSVYINGDTDKIHRPVSIFIKGDREEDKLEEYIYEVPTNNTSERAEYDYITINNINRPQSDLQKPIGSTYSINRLIKHKTEADLTSTNNQDFTLRPKHPVPRSAPNLQSITSPYDVRLVSQRPKHPSPSPTDGEHAGMFTPSSTIDKSETNTYNKSAKNNSPLIDILKMTPIAFFWTGCAFLITIVYIFVFSCPHEHN